MHVPIIGFWWNDCIFWKAIYVPADDLTDPAPATTFAHLDATTVLSRGIAELGIYPAVDPLDSTSRIMDPNVVGQEHYEVARGVQKILQVSTMLGSYSTAGFILVDYLRVVFDEIREFNVVILMLKYYQESLALF